MINKPIPPGNAPLVGGSNRVAKAKAQAEAVRLKVKQLQYEEEQARIAERIKYYLHLAKVDVLSIAIPAVRAWDLDRDFQLRALTGCFVYEGPVTRNDSVPLTLGRNGFWAVKPNHLDIVMGYQPQVIGFVELQGERVVEHEYGWRAEVCAIQELFVAEENIDWRYDSKRLYSDLEERYQCDVHKFQGVDDLLRRMKG